MNETLLSDKLTFLQHNLILQPSPIEASVCDKYSPFKGNQNLYRVALRELSFGGRAVNRVSLFALFHRDYFSAEAARCCSMLSVGVMRCS